MVTRIFRWAAINAEVLVVQCTDVMVARPYPSNTNNDGFERIDVAPDSAVRQIVEYWSGIYQLSYTRIFTPCCRGKPPRKHRVGVELPLLMADESLIGRCELQRTLD